MKKFDPETFGPLLHGTARAWRSTRVLRLGARTLWRARAARPELTVVVPCADSGDGLARTVESVCPP